MANRFKRYIKPVIHSHASSIALVILRLIVGGAFIIHGFPKIQNPTSWMGPDAPVPALFLLLAAISEFCGGIALILGLVTPIFSLFLACNMLVATYFHAVVRGDPFVGKGGSSYELALVFFGIALLFAAIGPGKYSLDAKIFGERK